MAARTENQKAEHLPHANLYPDPGLDQGHIQDPGAPIKRMVTMTMTEMMISWI